MFVMKTRNNFICFRVLECMKSILGWGENHVEEWAQCKHDKMKRDKFSEIFYKIDKTE